MKLYGLTGGIGCGKSEAAKRFVERGIPVIDADKIGHRMLEPGGPAAAGVVAAFGDAILTDGRIDRAKLGRVIFDDSAARRRLNALVHPPLMREVAEQCTRLGAAGHEGMIVDAALLAEDGRRDSWVTGLILVLCPADVRRRRLVEIRGMDPDEAQHRIDAQTPPEAKVPLADWVIENAGTIEDLRARVDEVADAILAAGA